MRKTSIVLCTLLLALPTASFASVSDDQVTSQKIREADNNGSQNTNTGSGVKTNHIQNLAVTDAKIADGAVTSAKIQDGAVSAADLAAAAVTDAKIADGAVTDAKIQGVSASKVSGLDGVYQKKYGKVIVVAKSGGDFTEPIAAVNSIGDASAANPYLVKIMPGVYDLGSQSLVMKEYVDVEGSGINVTSLSGAWVWPVVSVPSYAELRQLTVDVTDGTGVQDSGSYPAIRDVLIRTTSTPENLATGMLLVNSFADVQDVKFISTGFATVTLDIRSNNGGTTTPRLRGLDINVVGSYSRPVMNSNYLPVTIEDSRIVSLHASYTIDGGSVNLVRSHIESRSSGSAFVDTQELVIKDSYVFQDGGFGVVYNTFGSVKVSDSEIVHTSISGPIFNQLGGPVYVNNTKLVGLLYGGTVTKCISCFDADFNLITLP